MDKTIQEVEHRCATCMYAKWDNGQFDVSVRCHGKCTSDEQNAAKGSITNICHDPKYMERPDLPVCEYWKHIVFPYMKPKYMHFLGYIKRYDI